MRDWIQFAGLMRNVYGSFERAFSIAEDLYEQGVSALDGHGDDHGLLKDRAFELGLVDSNGRPQPARCARLLVLCDALQKLPDPASPPDDDDQHLLFTAPDVFDHQVTPDQQLDLYILRLIRMSTDTLRLGGPFWNETGLDRMFDVLKPAVSKRNVQCFFYVHYDEAQSAFADVLKRVQQTLPSDPITILWYRGPKNSLMHAKFVVRDDTEGYLGSANLTSLGLGHHLEAGVPLNSLQCEELITLLEDAVSAGLFREGDQPPIPEFNHSIPEEESS